LELRLHYAEDIVTGGDMALSDALRYKEMIKDTKRRGVNEESSTIRSSKEIQERMYRNRLEKIKVRGGFTAEELIQKANNPNFYRKKHRKVVSHGTQRI
jgi:hypothetical protein